MTNTYRFISQNPKWAALAKLVKTWDNKTLCQAIRDIPDLASHTNMRRAIVYREELKTRR